MERIRLSVKTANGRVTFPALKTFLKTETPAGTPDVLSGLVAVADLYGLKIRRSKKTHGPTA